ncbi:MAG TPA: hypothetical protein VNQ77_14605 [Frankiaceae bacterium]|nr:hypothetical protein [Frankiaceae bacterium]
MPALPAFPAGHAPANAPSTSQVVEHMTVRQNAAQPQPGLMAGEDEQVEEVAEYAFADRSGDAAGVALLGLRGVRGGGRGDGAAPARTRGDGVGAGQANALT